MPLWSLCERLVQGTCARPAVRDGMPTALLFLYLSLVSGFAFGACRLPLLERYHCSPATNLPRTVGTWCTAVCNLVSLGPPTQVRAFLRNSAGLPPVSAGMGILNHGHRALYERELLFLHHVLPKDADVHDGLQLIDGAEPNRHIELPVDHAGAGTVNNLGGETVLPTAPVNNLGGETVLPTAPIAPTPAPSAPHLSLNGTPPDLVLPTPPQPMRLAPLPVELPVIPGSQAAREAQHHPENDGDEEEEEEEIRPVSEEYASQWRAYYATRR